MRIPILTYQAMRIDGNDYASNDLRALASDLRQVAEAGFSILPLARIVELWTGNRGVELNGKIVALACNAGADFDAIDLPHPTAGTQRSVLNTLRDFAGAQPGRQPELNITSFVVASPEARTTLDRTCMLGKGWWTDGWWSDAIASGLMHLANHSWDHNHETLPGEIAPGVRRGTFLAIDTKERADLEIAQAANFLRSRAPNPGAGLFAYPYGKAGPYLAAEYFPCHAGELGIVAAFTDEAAFFEPGCNRWAIPRFVFGRDWRSSAELASILDEAARARGIWAPSRRSAASLMSPPREATTAPAQPRRRPSRLEVAFAPPGVEKTSRGLVPLYFDVDGPPGAYELTLRSGSSLLYGRTFTLGDDPRRLAAYLNSHFLRNGATRLEAEITESGQAVWSDAFAINVSNSGPVADQVRASLREFGTPLVLEDRVDSSAYDIGNRALSPWYDRPDALSRLAAMRASGAIDADEEAALGHFVDDGYTVLPARIEEPLLAAVERELDDAIEKQVEGYRFGTSQRIHHLHRRYPGVGALWQHPSVLRYLGLIFGVAPRACQTLTYIFGSQQGAHQDTIHLTPFPAGYMCGVWIALEDVRPDSGELEVYRGSHRLPRVYMNGSGCAKVTNDDWTEFGDTISARWRDMIARGGFEKVKYRPKRGTILIWHENLMHGGSVRIDQSLSRRSIVSHYFADGAIAFYDSTGVAGHME